jgi:hypothetical protein
MTHRSSTALALTLMTLAAPVPVFAQVYDLGDLSILFLNIIDTLIPVLIMGALAAFLYGLVKYVLVGAERDRQDAIWYMTWGIIALFVMVSVWGLVEIFTNTFDIVPGLTPFS